MSASMLNLLSKIPVPLFSNARIATQFALQKSHDIPKFAPMGGALAIGGAWLIWPALTDEFKIDLGIMADPEAVAQSGTATADVDKKEVMSGVAATSQKVDVWAAVEAKGDFSHLESGWEKFAVDSLKGDDEDDDDDDDDEDEDEDGEEEEEDDDDDE
mmetsp:Transcript_62271/g.73768  ORF Transcript_62271/g.73768 Transcript_62271/m.73768 type:complete len:158 (-) Transcript_62271:216-689(-)|eukprot:CAMPEP_0172485090 /NCGR_PEP_ID=MMETSP1066-20121228/12898_1 /TAXON_ID=671091 /ORGANISM="Coscinodiscus wailesii, Strain CCMP2513" /LENGTH=157 /DNA_ID=CAMNT_0013250053 /DNA_START=170 /DNA_END=643 /DNA_ORIENTATION=-